MLSQEEQNSQEKAHFDIIVRMNSNLL